MTPLLKSLLGNGSKDRELAEELRAVLEAMQRERSRCETIIQDVQASANRLQELGEPIAKAGSDVDAVAGRLEALEPRFTTITQLSAQVQALDERSAGLSEGQQRSESQLAQALDEAQRIRAVFEDLSKKALKKNSKFWVGLGV